MSAKNSPERNAGSGKKQKSSPDFASLAQQVGAQIGASPAGGEGSEDGRASKLPAGLYVTAVPIGNLGDITLRALDALTRCDAVACEDTRVTGGLLHRYGIKQKLISYHDHNAQGREPELLARLGKGEAIVLVSDAGTPLISDPGYRLVQACRGAGHMVTALPGASALLTALASAGLPTDQFLFAGFLPVKAGAREKALQALAPLPASLVFYETAPRLAAALEAMAKVFGGDRPATVARELTKLFETVETEPLNMLAARYSDAAVKGEIVIIVGPPVSEGAPVADADEMLRIALKSGSVRDAVAAVVVATGLKKSEIYQRALILGKEQDGKDENGSLK